MISERILTLMKKVTTLFVMCAFVFSATAFTPAHRAHAGGAAGIMFDPTNWIQNAYSAARELISATLTNSLVVKDYVLDGIAFAIINMIIQQMSQDILSWVNSGFKGDPAFVRNFDGFLTGIGDRAVGEFIGGTELGSFLCSPFRIQIRVALELQYAATRNFGAPANSCTLSGIEKNIDDFMNGKVVMGSWNDWFKMTQNPQYNAHGAMLLAQQKLSMSISNSKGQQTELLAWGKGMLSSQVCTETATSEDGSESCLNYETVTPGTTIENALNDALAAPGNRIEVADEMNEIFAALFNQLVAKAFSGVGGLLGLTGSSGSTPRNPYYQTLTTEVANSNSSLTNPRLMIEKAITTETKYRNLEQQIVDKLTSAANYRESTYPGDYCHSGTLPPQLQEQLDAANTQVTLANDNITKLNAILAEYIAAGSDSNLLRAASQKFVDFQSSGVLHTEADNTMIITVGMPTLQKYIDDFIAEIDSVCPTDLGDGGGGGGGGGIGPIDTGD